MFPGNTKQPNCEKVIAQKINHYDSTFAEKIVEKRSKDAQLITDNFYNLVNGFYEYGWGDSYHFASRAKDETFRSSIKRHQHYIASKIRLSSEDSVLDIGCGIMGPAREIARFSGAKITGLNINKLQVDRCIELNCKSDCSSILKVQYGDFMSIPFKENSFDKIYSIEALCHAPNRLKAYREALRVLKPKGLAGFYLWGMTKAYDPQNETHSRIKEQIEYGNSICELDGLERIVSDLKQAGFTILEKVDIVEEAQSKGLKETWYSTLQGRISLSNIKHTVFGRAVMHNAIRFLESVRLLPEGMTRVHSVLTTAADALVEGGELGIFTPMFFVLLQKPEME